jgi:hypothetical protein
MPKSGTLNGKPADPDSVKRKTDFQGIPIHIDRPKGFTMHGQDEKGAPWSRTYQYDYGFIPKTTGGDGDGLDVFIGPDPDAHESYWAVQNKPDGNFDEYKIFLGFDNRDAATAAYRQHIPLKFLRGMVAVKVDMLKALLGIDAEGYHHHQTKVAEFMGFASVMEGP